MRIYWFSIWRNLDPLHPRILCAKFGWNWSSGSGEEDFLISSMYFHNFVIISPWKRAGPFNWTNLNPLHPRMLCAVWLKLAQWFWRRRFLHFRKYILLFHIYLPFEKGGALQLNKLESPLPKDALSKLGWNWPSGSGEEDENVKSLQQRRQRQRTYFDQKSSLEPYWAQVSYNIEFQCLYKNIFNWYIEKKVENKS